ncbi:hypothetical protein VaNZ11_005564 [Volvox africanus]|uniref:Uncharacterized protein n=1 Tax=Volvox africanus TaxID=51714 RepID=A0ABQ5RZ00_9CHLO|nr:hypothetical protein VaNZ11_005564 [Volvox africanus]
MELLNLSSVARKKSIRSMGGAGPIEHNLSNTTVEAHLSNSQTPRPTNGHADFTAPATPTSITVDSPSAALTATAGPFLSSSSSPGASTATCPSVTGQTGRCTLDSYAPSDTLTTTCSRGTSDDGFGEGIKVATFEHDSDVFSASNGEPRGIHAHSRLGRDAYGYYGAEDALARALHLISEFGLSDDGLHHPKVLDAQAALTEAMPFVWGLRKEVDGLRAKLLDYSKLMADRDKALARLRVDVADLEESRSLYKAHVAHHLSTSATTTIPTAITTTTTITTTSVNPENPYNASANASMPVPSTVPTSNNSLPIIAYVNSDATSAAFTDTNIITSFSPKEVLSLLPVIEESISMPSSMGPADQTQLMKKSDSPLSSLQEHQAKCISADEPAILKDNGQPLPDDPSQLFSETRSNHRMAKRFLDQLQLNPSVALAPGRGVQPPPLPEASFSMKTSAALRAGAAPAATENVNSGAGAELKDPNTAVTTVGDDGEAPAASAETSAVTAVVGESPFPLAGASAKSFGLKVIPSGRDGLPNNISSGSCNSLSSPGHRTSAPRSSPLAVASFGQLPILGSPNDEEVRDDEDTFVHWAAPSLVWEGDGQHAAPVTLMAAASHGLKKLWSVVVLRGDESGGGRSYNADGGESTPLLFEKNEATNASGHTTPAATARPPLSSTTTMPSDGTPPTATVTPSQRAVGHHSYVWRRSVRNGNVAAGSIITGGDGIDDSVTGSNSARSSMGIRISPSSGVMATATNNATAAVPRTCCTAASGGKSSQWIITAAEMDVMTVMVL